MLPSHPRTSFNITLHSHLYTISAIEWISFEVLNIGLPVIDSIAIWPRITAALFQGLAARASGFAIVPIAETAPALQFLYVVMMYIAVSLFSRLCYVAVEATLMLMLCRFVC